MQTDNPFSNLIKHSLGDCAWHLTDRELAQHMVDFHSYYEDQNRVISERAYRRIVHHEDHAETEGMVVPHDHAADVPRPPRGV